MGMSHRSRWTRCAVAVLSALMVAAAGADGASARCQNTGTVPASRAEQVTAEASVLCLVNHERTTRGMKALKANHTLWKVASWLSDNMVARQFFDHTTPDGRDLRKRLDAFHWEGMSAGENIAWGTGDLGSPARIVKSWMHSPGHRANILHRAFRRGGVGVTAGVPEDVGGLAGATYTMDYDTP